MSTSLSNLVDNLYEGLHGEKYTDCKSYRDYKSVKDYQWNCTQLIFWCFDCKKIIRKNLTKN